AQREGHRAGVPHFEGGNRKHGGQALSAILDRTADRVPASLHPAPIELLPAVGHGDGAILQPGALLVANLAQRRDLVRGKPPCLFEDRVDEIGGKITETSARQRLVQASYLLQREANFLDRRAIHAALPSEMRASASASCFLRKRQT